MGFLIIILFFLDPASAQTKTQSSCEEMDIRNAQSPEIQEYLSTPINQTDMNNCWAHTTADILSVVTQKSISPFDISIKVMSQEKENDPENPHVPKLKEFGEDILLNGGYGLNPTNAINYLKNNKLDVCNMDSISDYKSWEAAANQLKVRNAIFEIEKVRQAFRIGDDISLYLPENCRYQIQDILKSSNFEEITETIGRLNDKTLIAITKELVKSNCKEPIPIPEKLKVFWVENNKKTKITSDIDESLSRNLPVGIILPMKEIHRDEENNDFHVVTILGKKMIGGKCSYIARNSWGIGCKAYNEKYQGHCNAKQGIFYLPVNRAIATITYIHKVEPIAEKPE